MGHFGISLHTLLVLFIFLVSLTDWFEHFFAERSAKGPMDWLLVLTCLLCFSSFNTNFPFDAVLFLFKSFPHAALLVPLQKKMTPFPCLTDSCAGYMRQAVLLEGPRGEINGSMLSLFSRGLTAWAITRSRQPEGNCDEAQKESKTNGSSAGA